MNKARLLTLLLLLVGRLATPAVAQEKVEVNLSADFVNQYVWRGQDLGHVSIQPALGIGWRGLSIEAWGNVGITTTDDPREINLTASYNTGGLTFGLVDYWSNSANDRYFYYQAHGTSHVFEAFAAYDFGLFSASWQTIFAGNDGLNKKEKRAYSSYFEIAAPFRLAGCDWQAAAGLVPYATTYYETTGLAVTNVSLRVEKELKITDHFTLPVFGQLIANPCSERAYFVFGFTLRKP
ncbi:MAG: hypothetical protein IJ614_00050 [Prevotella sp.]|nr:hypothetical protein [Prevotella sp.]